MRKDEGKVSTASHATRRVAEESKLLLGKTQLQEHAAHSRAPEPLLEVL